MGYTVNLVAARIWTSSRQLLQHLQYAVRAAQRKILKSLLDSDF